MIALMATLQVVMAQAPVEIPTPEPIVVSTVEIPNIVIPDIRIPDIPLNDIDTHTIDMGVEETNVSQYTLSVAGYNLTFIIHYYTIRLWLLGFDIANILIGAIGARVIWAIITS